MGIQFLETKSQPTMKVLLIVALVIAAAVTTPEAEADADAAAFYYRSYNHGYYGRPWGYGDGGYNRNYYGGYYGNRWGGYGYGRHGYWKRSADAEPEAEAEADADAAVFYTTAYPQQYYGNMWNNGFRTYSAGYPFTATTYQSTYPYGMTYGAWPFTTYNFNRYNPMYNTQQVTRVARDAEAEPEAEADADAAYYYRSSFGYPRSYSYGFNNGFRFNNFNNFYGNWDRQFYGNYRNYNNYYGNRFGYRW